MRCQPQRLYTYRGAFVTSSTLPTPGASGRIGAISTRGSPYSSPDLRCPARTPYSHSGTRQRVPADVAQLVAHHLAKVRVASSSLVIRSDRECAQVGLRSVVVNPARWIGREARQRPAKPFTRVQIPYPPPNCAPRRRVWAIGAAVARFPDTEEVTGSIPVSPTAKDPRKSGVFCCLGCVVAAPI